jgi:peptidoglycan hydrolase-like protein with peptidoglycan-binding domain/DNA invertase Pin-like site-specific DNA recombinase
MKTTIRVAAAQLATTLIAAAVLLSALPDKARAADSKAPSPAAALLAKGAGYELPSGSQRVRLLQRQLRRLGQRPGPIDGLFGPLTQGAVRRFQRQAALRSDGLVGPQTAARLARSMAAIRNTAVKRQRQDRRLRQAHRALLNDGPAAVDSGRQEQPRSAPGAGQRRALGRTSDTPALLVGLLIGLCAAPVLVLLSTQARRSRAGAARRRGDDLAEPHAPTPMRVAVPSPGSGLGERGLVDTEPPANNGNNRAQAPGQHGRAELSQDDAALAARRPAAERAESGAAAAAYGAPTGSQAPGPAAESPSRPGVPVIGYVSVGDQERLVHGEGYAGQARTIETFCRRHGLRLVRIVRDVESIGSRGAAAPGLNHACQALADGEARALVVQELGRLTRSPARLALLLRWLADADRALIAIATELDTSTAAGRKTAKALIEVGEWEHRRTEERRARNRVHSAGGGRPSVRDLPELHARIAAMRDEGLSLHGIADTLNAEGVPTLRGGARWRPSSVQAAVGYRRPTARDGTGLTLPTPTPPATDEEAG